jgi:hypothetical protein
MRTCQCEFRLPIVVELFGAGEASHRVTALARASIFTTTELRIVYIRVTPDTVGPPHLSERQGRESNGEQLE